MTPDNRRFVRIVVLKLVAGSLAGLLVSLLLTSVTRLWPLYGSCLTMVVIVAVFVWLRRSYRRVLDGLQAERDRQDSADKRWEEMPVTERRASAAAARETLAKEER